VADTAGLTQVTMPQLGESVTEGQVSRWLKAPGDRVEKYEALVEVITDKVNAEVPSPVAGVMGEILVAEGETVEVGTLICSIQVGAGAPTADAGPAEAVPAEAAAVPAGEPDDAELAPAQAAPPAPSAPPPALPPAAASNGDRRGGRAGRASPAVRRLAEEHGIDIGTLRGTGIGGRVSKKDVEDHLAGGRASAPAAPAVATAAAPQPQPAAAAAPAPTRPGPAAGDELIPLNAMRKAIAEHMVRSRRTSPHAWCAVEVDMTSVVALRRAEREAFRAIEGVDLSYVPFVIKAACESLRAHPSVNATFTDDGILRHAAINISIAVALDDGLILPVIHDADRLSITGLAHQLSELADRARAGKLTLPDVERGTFCVNNPGTFGTVISAPIINQPQAAIMTMEAIVKRPAVMPGDLIGIRSMMYAAMSFDHRVLDGLEAASFLRDVKQGLEAMGPGTPLR
jgi:2-oxoisovalerate dehydrogenase E2 component (dihydrolipoyl transacylase)